jgi:hypothetical protein
MSDRIRRRRGGRSASAANVAVYRTTGPPVEAGCSATATRLVYRCGLAAKAARLSGDEKRYIRAW